MKLFFTQLNRQKVAGFVLPILLGWLVITCVSYFTFFEAPRFGGAWIMCLLMAACISMIPILGYVMGIMNVYLWRHQKWSEQNRKENSNNLLIYFWVIFPITYVLIASIFGMVVFPIHVICFFHGQKIGKRWIEADMFNQFLGRSNDWERKDLE